MSARSMIIAIVLFAGLSVANDIVYQRQIPQSNPYGTQGSALGTIAAAASIPDQQRQATTGFWLREGAVALLTVVLLFAFSGVESRR